MGYFALAIHQPTRGETLRRKPLPKIRSDAIRMAVALLARGPLLKPEVEVRRNGADIHWAAQALRGRLASAISRLASFTAAMVDGIYCPRKLDGYVSLFGPAWPRHPLRHSPRIHGYRTHEPHLTKTLAEFLRPRAPQLHHYDRANGFLAGLFQAGGVASRAPCQSSMMDLTVTAEQPIGRSPNSKRIDLFFAWTEGSNRRLVAVEIKFRHIAMRGTLPAYRQYLQSIAGSGQIDLFLVTLQPDALARRNSDWVPVGWLNLLRSWERYVADNADTDDDFTRFRAELWRQIGNGVHA